MSAVSVLECLAARPLVRRLTDVGVGRYARRRVAELNRRPVERLQRQTLLRLVRHARDTRFGRDHGFASIRSVADYQRQVPLRDYDAFWVSYWQPTFPFLKGATWPDPIPYLALSSGTTTGTTKYLPLSRQMLASNQRAAFTSLALFLDAHPGTPLFTGKLFFLGGSTDLQDLGARYGRPGERVLAGDLSGITTLEASPLLRPFAFPPVELALVKDWEQK